MKKLSLEKLKMAAEDVLQRSQLAGVYGGSGGGSGCSVCYLYNSSMQLIQTLSSAGHCNAGPICFNLRPWCHTWSCQ
jgi:hypothetical protein